MKFLKRHAYALLYPFFSDGGKCLLSLKGLCHSLSGLNGFSQYD